jgi:hypothetical protein
MTLGHELLGVFEPGCSSTGRYQTRPRQGADMSVGLFQNWLVDIKFAEGSDQTAALSDGSIAGGDTVSSVSEENVEVKGPHP